MTESTHQATPDTLIALMVCPWTSFAPEILQDTHADYWQASIKASWADVVPTDDEDTPWSTGQIEFEDGTIARIIVEPPIEQLATLTDECPVPFQLSEIQLVEQHQSLWRVMIKGGQSKGRRAAKHLIELMTTFLAAGACGVFLPALARLHSPGMIRQLTQDPGHPQTISQVCLSAWHEDQWMITRGLTAFGLPELETSTNQGFNGAFFCLMDVAANMIFQMAAYPPDRQLQLGHKMYDITEGPAGPSDDININGTFGTMTIRAV